MSVEELRERVHGAVMAACNEYCAGSGCDDDGLTDRLVLEVQLELIGRLFAVDHDGGGEDWSWIIDYVPTQREVIGALGLEVQA